MEFASDRSWRLPVEPAVIVDALEHTDRFEQWWPWLRLESAPRLEEGARATAVVTAPWAYRLRFVVHVLAVSDHDGRLTVDADVTGDLAGSARLEVTPSAGGQTSLRLRWRLRPRRPLVRALAAVAHPVLVWGHERVLDVGIAQLQAAAVGTLPTERARSWPVVLRAAAIGALVSGVPSTVHAVAARGDVRRSTVAVAEAVGRAGLVPGLAVHGVVSLGWSALLARVLPRRATVAWGALGGLAIAAIDLGVVARRWFPTVAVLPTGPQVADHIVFGAVVGAVVAHADRWEPDGGADRYSSGNRRRTQRP